MFCSPPLRVFLSRILLFAHKHGSLHVCFSRIFNPSPNRDSAVSAEVDSYLLRNVVAMRCEDDFTDVRFDVSDARLTGMLGLGWESGV